MKLYGHHISVTTLQVLLTLAEKDLIASQESVDVFNQVHKSPSFLRLHPFGHIPVLQDGDFTLYETHAILRYLDYKGPGASLVPGDPQHRARMDQWMCIEQNYLVPAAKKVMARGYAEMMHQPDPGEHVAAEGMQALEHCLRQFGKVIADSAFVAGEQFTLADIVWAADLHDMSGKISSVSAMMNSRMEEWLNLLRRRPNWQEAIHARSLYEPPENK